MAELDGKMLNTMPRITIPQIVYEIWSCSKGHQGQCSGNRPFSITFDNDIAYCYECYCEALSSWAAAELGTITITPAERPKP